jgi:hypothetical protein
MDVAIWVEKYVVGVQKTYMSRARARMRWRGVSCAVWQAMRRCGGEWMAEQRAVVVVYDFLHSEPDAPPHLHGRRYSQHTVDWYAGQRWGLRVDARRLIALVTGEPELAVRAGK